MTLERGQEYLQGNVEKAFIFIGPPTSGKTSQTLFLRDRLGAELVRGKYILPDEAELLGARRELVPDKLFVPALKIKLDSLTSKNVILDNIPRSRPQANAVVQWAEASGAKLYVVRLRLTEQDVLYRGEFRLACTSCGATYHPDVKPSLVAGLCDNDQTRLDRRAGDKPGLLKQSYRLHMKEADKIIADLSKAAMVFDVPAGGKVADTTERMMQMLSPAFF